MADQLEALNTFDITKKILSLVSYSSIRFLA